jgi:hypothetical protein
MEIAAQSPDVRTPTAKTFCFTCGRRVRHAQKSRVASSVAVTCLKRYALIELHATTLGGASSAPDAPAQITSKGRLETVQTYGALNA